MPKLTLWFLQASRSIRIAWLLEELGLDYDVKFADRENGVAPPAFKKEAGGLGKFPMLEDGDLRIQESGCIVEYLCDTYDKQHRLLPAVGDKKRYEILYWVHAAEAMWALHGIAILYVRWFQKDGDVAKTEEGLSKNITGDMNYLEDFLSKGSGKYLSGDAVSAADCMMQFSASFILARELGVKAQSYPKTQQYLRDCEATETYKKAVQKTGHKL